MQDHQIPSNVSSLAIITRDTAKSILDATQHILSFSYSIQTPELLAATFSALASRIDNLSALADQLDKLALDLENALTTPTPTP